MTEAERVCEFFECASIHKNAFTHCGQSAPLQERPQADAEVLLEQLIGTTHAQREIRRQCGCDLIERSRIQPCDELIHAPSALVSTWFRLHTELGECVDENDEPGMKSGIMPHPISDTLSRSTGGFEISDCLSCAVDASEQFERCEAQFGQSGHTIEARAK